MTRRKVAVVVLNWNGWRDSLVCLDSLRPAVRNGVARIIVVDNASSDDSVRRIREWLNAASEATIDCGDDAIGELPPLTADLEYVLIRAGRNGGYASGNNIGIRLALSIEDTEFVFLLNNDASVEPEGIARLVEHAGRERIAGIIGSTLVEDGGNLRIAGGNRYNPFLTTSRPRRIGVGSWKTDIDYVAGAAQFIRAAALRKVGLLNEDYFLYFEELDLTRRITAAGFTISWCPQSIVYHRGGRTAGSRSGTNRKSSLAEYHSNLSCLLFMRRFHPRLLWLAALVRFTLKVAHNLIHHQPNLVVPLIRAYRDYLAYGRKHAA